MGPALLISMVWFLAEVRQLCLLAKLLLLLSYHRWSKKWVSNKYNLCLKDEYIAEGGLKWSRMPRIGNSKQVRLDKHTFSVLLVWSHHMTRRTPPQNNATPWGDNPRTCEDSRSSSCRPDALPVTQTTMSKHWQDCKAQTQTTDIIHPSTSLIFSWSNTRLLRKQILLCAILHILWMQNTIKYSENTNTAQATGNNVLRTLLR